MELALLDEHPARLRALVAADDAAALEHVDEPAGARVADAQAALEERDRRGLRLDDDLDRLVEQRVVVGVEVAVLATVGVRVGENLGQLEVALVELLLAPLYALTGRAGAPEDFRGTELGGLDLELAEAVLAEGPATAPELRALVGADKRPVDAAVLRLQRALVLTNARLVEQDQGWGAIAVDLVTRRWREHVLGLPAPDEARRTLGRTVLASAGELSAADLGGALGWRLKPARELLDELAERGEARRREEHGLVLWRTKA